jgi:diguanylate cyclase (GGDEF)-like protein
MKKYVYAVGMVLYIGFSIIVINYASKWMTDKNYSVIASKAKDIAILTAKNYRITDAEVEELKRLDFKDLGSHPANMRLVEMFNDEYGHEDIRFVYVMVDLDREHIKYYVTEEYEDYFDAPAGTPLNVLYLTDVVIGKTLEEILIEDESYYVDIKRYSYFRESDRIAFENKVPTYAMTDSEYGFVINGVAPMYTEEGSFVGMLGVDIYIDEYERNANSIRMLLLIVFLLPSVALTAVYFLLYVFNLKKALDTAQMDPLTSVRNRRFMDKHFHQLITEHYKKQLPLSVIMIDIDFFKKYNDNYGHQQGDKVLIDVTKAISSILREKTDVLCRYGGEEFVVILAGAKVHIAERVADRIKTAVNGIAIKHEDSEAAGFITVSQGVYSAVPSNTDSEKTFIEYADRGLYKAKNSGRNKYIIMEVEH